jgi:acyl carrier protein
LLRPSAAKLETAHGPTEFAVPSCAALLIRPTQDAAQCDFGPEVLDMDSVDIEKRLKRIIGDTLMLGNGAQELDADSRLLGGIPEFDSMAVVSVLTSIEEGFGVTIEDDDLNAEVFESVGSLTQFVSRKLSE